MAKPAQITHSHLVIEKLAADQELAVTSSRHQDANICFNLISPPQK